MILIKFDSEKKFRLLFHRGVHTCLSRMTRYKAFQDHRSQIKIMLSGGCIDIKIAATPSFWGYQDETKAEK